MGITTSIEIPTSIISAAIELIAATGSGAETGLRSGNTTRVIAVARLIAIAPLPTDSAARPEATRSQIVNRAPAIKSAGKVATWEARRGLEAWAIAAALVTAAVRARPVLRTAEA